MNFIKFIFPAALIAAILISPAAQAQKAKDLVNDWADDMSRIVEQQGGAARRAALKERTGKLSRALQAMPCEGRDAAESLSDWVRSQRVVKKLPVEVNAKLVCDGGKLKGEVALAIINLDADDITYNLALVNNTTLANWFSIWGDEEQAAISSIKDPVERARKVRAIAKSWDDKMTNIKCHPKAKFDFKQTAMQEKEKRKLPLHVIAAGECHDGEWRIHLQADLENG